MSTWLWILGVLYLAILAAIALYSWRRTTDADDYIMAGSNVGVAFGLLTYAATLFSTFTLMGMPDFFRTHGVGAWIFLAVSDAVQVFLIVWFGYRLRLRARSEGFRGTAGLLVALYDNRWAGYLFFAGVFLFLVPYVAIQVRGIAIFVEAVFPGIWSSWVWSTIIVVAMLVYSEVGGLRAIIYSDVLQGLTLLTVLWIVAIGCVDAFGGIEPMFERVASVNEGLLSVPGPQGLFSTQFLLASFFGVVLLPVTQPHLTTRLMIMESTDKMNRMAVSIGTFAIVILLPVVAIGMYGAVFYGEASTREFLANVLLFEQSNLVAAACIVGLFTAAMSTADSQLFALGTELRSLLSGDEKVVLRQTKIAIVCFGIAALAFSVVSSDQLVLLARVSFNGTALLAPMILGGVFLRRAPGVEVLYATALGLVLFLGSLVGVVSDMVGPFRLDLFLLVAIAVVTALSALLRHRQAVEVEAAPAPPSLAEEPTE